MTSSDTRRPNVVFIVADDLGFADLGCYGGRPARFGAVSPVLDALATQGMRFTHGYANSPVCSPTRFALATGRYQYRFRGAAEEPISSANSQRFGLAPELPTIPSLLQRAGYRTALVGKWHLGHPPKFGPLKSGYQEFFGALAGAVDYWTHKASGGRHDLWSGEDECTQEGYLTDLLSQRAVQFIDRAAADPQRPFFLSLHYTAPHWPWETRDDAAAAQQVAPKLYHLDGGSVETYRRMIHHMDEGIGWVLQALQRHRLERDTLVVFTSDNGGERYSDNWPLVGGKMDLTEGGIRVPWIARWPALIASGSTCEQPCMTMDWSATVLAAAGCAADANHPLDGVSLLDVLRAPDATFERPMYWRMKHRDQRACRIDGWKYLRVDGNEYLFDLRHDARERANAAAREPERLQALRASWDAWNASMPATPDDALVTLVYTERDMPAR